MIGDRMDTDVVSGMEAGLETMLVLTGLTTREAADREPYRASRVVDSIADLLPDLGLIPHARPEVESERPGCSDSQLVGGSATQAPPTTEQFERVDAADLCERTAARRHRRGARPPRSRSSFWRKGPRRSRKVDVGVPNYGGGDYYLCVIIASHHFGRCELRPSGSSGAHSARRPDARPHAGARAFCPPGPSRPGARPRATG